MRSMLAILSLSFTALAAAAPLVDLDAPGALDALRASNPDHYGRVLAVLDAAQLQPCETLPAMLKAKARADGVRCHGALLLTSFPPKRHLAFRLDDVDYVSNVVQANLAGKFEPVPARAK